jgi:CBS domain containing-hemolysin-like protein
MSDEITEKPRLSIVESEPAGPIKRLKGWLRSNLRAKDNSLKEALEEVLVEHQEEGQQLPQQEEAMLKNVLGFGNLAVKDIMTPRSEIKAVEYNIPLAELKEHITQHRHTRVPVYNDTLDNVKGFIHIKDLVPLLSGENPFNMALILRDMIFVPPSMKLISLLVRMRVAGVHMAIVIDEYGGTDGLVTLEDLFEQIVGEIQDEHDDEDENQLVWNAQDMCDVDARIPIERLTAELGLIIKDVQESGFETLGGLIFHQLGRVPKKGEKLKHESGAEFEILSVDPRRIHKVRIYKPVEAQPETAEK